MIPQIQKASLQTSLKEHQEKINLSIRKIILIAFILCVFLIVVCSKLTSNFFLYISIPICFYFGYTCYQFIFLNKTKNQIKSKINNNSHNLY